MDIYFILLIASKSLKVIGILLAFYLIGISSCLSFLFGFKLITGLLLLLFQKPFSAGFKIGTNDLKRLLSYCFLNIILDVLLYEGLALCGPLRTVLLVEHADVVITNLFFVAIGDSTLAKSRGAFFFGVGVLSITFLDHDLMQTIGHPEGQHKSNFIHYFYELFINIGLSDHKLGACLLLLACIGRVALNSTYRSLSMTMGGAKRLHSINSLISACMLVPIYLVNAAFIGHQESNQNSDLNFTMLLLLIALTSVIYMVDFYANALAVSKFGQTTTSQTSYLVLSIVAVILSVFWPFELMLHRPDSDKHSHKLSIGVLFSLFCMQYACRLLSITNNRMPPSGPIMSNGFMGVQDHTKQMHHREKSLSWHVRHTLEEIFKEQSSRRIFGFLCANLAFTFVELSYGVWTNSLGLISDGFHMFFDCAALVMGLYASVIGHWDPNRAFSYGYHRAEVISGFINALFLLIISASVFVKAFARLHHPPEILTDRLLFVSIAGLLVNLVGVFALGHAHSHGGQPCDGHSHNGASSEAEEANMRGVYLHVLADTLGSVGVIFSSMLVTWYGWYIADPICSIFIAVIIGVSSVPLMRQTASVLALQGPLTSSPLHLTNIVRVIVAQEGVLRVFNPQIWSHTPEQACLNVRVLISPTSNQVELQERIKQALHQLGPIEHLTLQLERENLLSSLAQDEHTASVLKPVLEFDKNLQLQAYHYVRRPAHFD